MSDLGAGEAAGCTKILVRTGYGSETEKQVHNYPFQPDYVADNLLEAVKWILKQDMSQGRDINAESTA
jgi:D-glycero-D-manno-heptose 1,7-bisphosphate phosphatase